MELNSFTVPEADLPDTSDPAVLDWAAAQGRIVVTHDHRTMRAYAEERLKTGLPMAGLILVRQRAPVGQAIDDLVLVAEATTVEEWYGMEKSFSFPCKMQTCLGGQPSAAIRFGS